ncbi:MAG: methyltransferase [Desulfobacca sp.]|uniref:methyltransferase n=1 Tax=Desulfobacca sp. TaxID=2067990 RepID=UPI00404B7BD5
MKQFGASVWAPSWCRPEAIPAKVDKVRLQHNFGRQVARYDQYATVQRRLAADLVDDLCSTGEQFGRILEIGCGTGYLTSLLRRAFPQARLTALDLAPAAVHIAQARLAGASGIDWLVGDGEKEVPGRFDLITSSAVFQWFSQPAQACRRYYQALTPGGVLAFATLGPLTFQELAQSFLRAGELWPELARPEIPAQHFASGQDWQEFLTQAEFQDIRRRQEVWPEVYPDLWAFLRAVRGMGATSTRPQFLPRRLLAAMASHYYGNFSCSGGIRVTYEVMWLWGRKPAGGESA